MAPSAEVTLKGGLIAVRNPKNLPSFRFEWLISWRFLPCLGGGPTARDIKPYHTFPTELSKKLIGELFNSFVTRREPQCCINDAFWKSHRSLGFFHLNVKHLCVTSQPLKKQSFIMWYCWWVQGIRNLSLTIMAPVTTQIKSTRTMGAALMGVARRAMRPPLPTVVYHRIASPDLHGFHTSVVQDFFHHQYVGDFTTETPNPPKIDGWKMLEDETSF